MDYLLVLLVLWALYTIYRNVISGFYIYILYIVVSYFLLGLFISGPKWKIFLSVLLANLFSVSMLITKVMSILNNKPK
jgi:hypothetical protein